jgi:alkylation response protein AidB-like acyl-CoA dehydrogenase
MDFDLMDRDKALQQDVRGWLAAHYPNGFGAAGEATVDLADDQTWEFARDFAKQLAQKGWVAPSSPREWGGADMDPMEEFIFRKEMALHGAPLTGSENAVEILGPVFLGQMTDAQKLRLADLRISLRLVIPRLRGSRPVRPRVATSQTRRRL